MFLLKKQIYPIFFVCLLLTVRAEVVSGQEVIIDLRAGNKVNDGMGTRTVPMPSVVGVELFTTKPAEKVIGMDIHFQMPSGLMSLKAFDLPPNFFGMGLTTHGVSLGTLPPVNFARGQYLGMAYLELTSESAVGFFCQIIITSQNNLSTPDTLMSLPVALQPAKGRSRVPVQKPPPKPSKPSVSYPSQNPVQKKIDASVPTQVAELKNGTSVFLKYRTKNEIVAVETEIATVSRYTKRPYIVIKDDDDSHRTLVYLDDIAELTVIANGGRHRIVDRRDIEPKSAKSKPVGDPVQALLSELHTQGFMGVKGKVDKNQILMDVHINGKKQRMMLDTGATHSMIRNKTADKFKMKTLSNMTQIYSTHFGRVDARRVVAEEFKVAGFRLRPWKFSAHDRRSNRDVIGTDLLYFGSCLLFCKSSVLFIDVDQKPARVDDLFRQAGYSSTKMQVIDADLGIKMGGGRDLLGSVPYLTVTIEGANGTVILDTGAFFTTIDREFLESTGRHSETFRLYEMQDMANLSQRVRKARIERIEVNDMSLSLKKEIQVTEDYQREGPFGYPLVGVFGMEFLAECDAVLDFGNRRMYFKKAGK